MHTSQKIVLVIASHFLIWHTLALVIGPAPRSYLRGNALPVIDWYLSLLRLKVGWAFYAPEPALGSVLNYRIINKHGKEHEFDIYADQIDKWSVSYFRYNAFFNNINQDSEEHRRYRTSFARYLCRKHADLVPHSVALIRIVQLPLTYEDYVNGARPLTPGYVNTVAGEPLACEA